MVRPRAKYAAAIAAVVTANRVIGAKRNHRFGSQRSAYQLQKTPSAIGSAKAPNADSSPRRAKRPSKKSVAKAAIDVQREAGATERSQAPNTLKRFPHPTLHPPPSMPSRAIHNPHH